MGDEPGGVVTRAEHRELDALRCRAYGPAADIFDDCAALSRLYELEDRVLVEHYPDDRPPPRSAEHTPTHAHATHGHVALVISTAAMAVVMGACAWIGGRNALVFAGTSADGPDGAASVMSYETLFEVHLDALRETLLSRSGMEDIAARLIRDQLRPLGTMYGREVGAGPTVDDEYCMIVIDLPKPSVTCVRLEDMSASSVSVVLPTWHVDPDTQELAGRGAPVRFTLQPSGGVTAETVERAAPKS